MMNDEFIIHHLAFTSHSLNELTMSAIRLILLLVVLGFLTLLLLQNWSPVLPLVFLGTQTQPLPLAVWILFGVVAGGMTSLFISGCFGLSNYFASPKPRKHRQAVGTPPPPGEQRRPDRYTAANSSSTTESTSYTTASTTSAQPKTNSPLNDDVNDWESDASDDWNFEADKQDTEKTPKSDTQDTVRDYTNYEVNAEPKSGSRSGSVYSYSYREPKNSGVGRTESVYDADYRVLTPPYRQTDTSKDEDDWGFEDDDDWLDEDENDSPRPKK